MAERESAVPPDQLLAALAHEHRRVLLRVLNQTDATSIPIDALVDHLNEHLSERDPERDPERDTAERRRRIQISLNHTHLPKLEASGLIVVDDEQTRVTPLENELAREVLALVEADDTRT